VEDGKAEKLVGSFKDESLVELSQSKFKSLESG
jgi:hypothetical protein